MKRPLAFTLCLVGGLLLLVAGWLLPIHIHAVNPSVLAVAGAGTPSVIDEGIQFVRNGNPGPARLLLKAAQLKGLPQTASLAEALVRVPAPQNSDASLSSFFDLVSPTEQPLTQFVLRLENRDRVLAYLGSSRNPAVQQLFQCRRLTNTVLFTPSYQAGGQAFDAALGVAGLLIEKGHLSANLREALIRLAETANKGKSEPLESALLDIMSLGQRLSWSQLTEFIHRIDSADTLRELTQSAREADQLPIIYSAVIFSDNPGGVAHYLTEFSQSGVNDLGEGLRYHLGGLKQLLRDDQRIAQPSMAFLTVTSFEPAAAYARAAARLAQPSPALALTLKWLAFLGAGFLLAALVLPMRTNSAERPGSPEFPLAQAARGILFALGFLLVILLLSEPFLAPESQKVALPLRLRLPMAGIAAHAGQIKNNPTSMNQIVITLLLFFVLQALIYTGCVMKLGEIRRQKIAPRMKLKLLENEDHLFDAGLYLGFVGTIISLILSSFSIIKMSLMAGYSSTSFGIIFVCIFKIFQLRPARRQLLMEAEAAEPKAVSTAATPTLASRS